jgi:hypothetical protein
MNNGDPYRFILSLQYQDPDILMQTMNVFLVLYSCIIISIPVISCNYALMKESINLEMPKAGQGAYLTRMIRRRFLIVSIKFEGG